MAKLSMQDYGLSRELVESERRSAQRAELMVQIDYSTVDEIFSEFTRDINEGGLFIETKRPRPIGTEVALRFNLPGGGSGIETTGRVVRTTEGDSRNPPGMGVEFDELSAQDRAQIDQLVRTLRIGNRRH